MNSFARAALILANGITAAMGTASLASGQQAPAPPEIKYAGPIIDVHMHTDTLRSAAGVPNPVTGVKSATSSETLRDAVIEQCKRYNIVRAVINGRPTSLPLWMGKDPTRFIAAPMILIVDQHPIIDVDTLRREIQAGRASALGEIMSQYMGFAPDDPALEPYWALAEELGVPAMIHTGSSFPRTAYSGYPNFRLRYGNPLLLEDVLVKHPKLRVWIAHGGFPWTRETFELMAQYPQVYMDVSAINWLGGAAARPEFHAFLKEAIDRGLEKRIMFGSDQSAWPDAIPLAIEGVDSAPFLTEAQKKDIFYNNAVTFLQLHDLQ